MKSRLPSPNDHGIVDSGMLGDLIAHAGIMPMRLGNDRCADFAGWSAYIPVVVKGPPPQKAPFGIDANNRPAPFLPLLKLRSSYMESDNRNEDQQYDPTR